MKRRRNTGHKPAKSRISPAENDARQWCRGRGCYLLVDGIGRQRFWTVFGLTDGREIGTYNPATGRYASKPYRDYVGTGTETDWRKALDRIVYRRPL